MACIEMKELQLLEKVMNLFFKPTKFTLITFWMNLYVFSMKFKLKATYIFEVENSSQNNESLFTNCASSFISRNEFAQSSEVLQCFLLQRLAQLLWWWQLKLVNLTQTRKMMRTKSVDLSLYFFQVSWVSILRLHQVTNMTKNDQWF